MPLPSPGWAMQPRALGLTSWCHARLCGRRLFCWYVRAMIVTGRHPAVRGNDRVCSACHEKKSGTVRSLPSACKLTAIGDAPSVGVPSGCPCLPSLLRSPGCCTDRYSGLPLVASAQNAFRCWCDTTSNLPHRLVLMLHLSPPALAAEREHRDAAAIALGSRARATRALYKLRHQRRRPVCCLALFLCRLSRAPP